MFDILLYSIPDKSFATHCSNSNDNCHDEKTNQVAFVIQRQNKRNVQEKQEIANEEMK